MTLTDYTSTDKGPPEWIEADQVASVQGRVDEDVVVELKLVPSDRYDDLRFELIRDGLPIPSDRYRLSMRGNIVQLALKQTRKNDTGYYSLVATKIGQEKDKGAVKKIHVNIEETSYEEDDPPVFLRRLSDLAVKVGTRTRFLVEIRSVTTPKITWYTNDAAIHEGPRFSLVHEGNFYCVDVVPVMVEDQGHWTCMAENRSGRSSCTSNLTVVVPKAYKKPEFIEELRALLTETGTVSLECKVVGVPTPMLRWFKDDKEIKAGDVFALTANPDDPTSLGVYTCEAVNCMGTAYSSSKVHVVGRGSREGSLKPADALTPSGPLPTFKQTLQDECCRIGDTLVLSCRVQVPPWPKAIVWYNKEGRVEPSEKYHVMEDGIGGYSIEVKQTEAMDEGEWKCVATSDDNMKQFTSCYVAMSIPRNYRKPRFMENLKAVLTEEGLVSFECKVVGFPTPLLRWFKDGQELKPGDVYQLTGTNSLGSYCCIARNCMGEAKSIAELTIEDIQNQLNEEERFQLLSTNQPPKFIKGLRSCEARISEDFRFTVQVSVAPEPSLSWYRDDALVDESEKYRPAKENLGTCHLDVQKLEFIDQAEWKCVAANDFGHSVTSCFLKLIVPKHYKKPKFLESLQAILSEEGAVNLECKVIGVPQPILKWYKDNVELKPGDIHRIISGQDGTCCLGTYTCEATNCMGTVSSSASLLGFEEKKNAKEVQSPNGHELARNLSLSTIHEERTSQLYDTPQTDHSVTLDERGEVSFSFDGKEVSVSLYETPDLTEEEALQIVEMYADELSEHVTEHNVIELPPMRFVKETSTSSNLLMEAVVIDVSPDYFVSAEDGDDLRTEADFEDVSIMDDPTHVLSSPERDSRGSLKRSSRSIADEDEKVPSRPPRKKSTSVSLSKSEKSQRIESESFHSAQKDEPLLSPLLSPNQDDSDTFADALSSAHLSVTESLVQKQAEHSAADNRKRSFSAERSTGSSLDDGIGGDSSLDSVTGVPKRKRQRKKKQRQDNSSSEEHSPPNDNEERKEKEPEDKVNAKIEQRQPVESIDKMRTDIGSRTEKRETLSTEEGPLGDLGSVKDTIPIVSDSADNAVVLEKARESILEDFLLESKTVLREALRACENAPDAAEPRLSDIRRQIDDLYRQLEMSQGKGVNIEVLINLETPLRALLKTLGEITSAQNMEFVRHILEPSIAQLSHAIENLNSPSLQPTLAILRKVDDRIHNVPNGTEDLSSTRSVSEVSQNAEKIVNTLIGVQSAFNVIFSCVEESKPTTNGAAVSQKALTGFAVCLAKLKECVSHTAHIAMMLNENETINSLMEFEEPLLDLQLALVSEERNPQELSIMKETINALDSLKYVVALMLEHSGNPETTSRVRTILKILEDADEQMSKLTKQLSEKAAQQHVLKNLNLDQSLSGVHFDLSSVLEKQEKHSCRLIECIEALRQTIGSSAIAIANLRNPVDDEITREISGLNESLLNLQKNLLTEKHEPGEDEMLNSLAGPISALKEIIHNVINSGSSIASIMPMLELLKEIEKDVPLIAKELSKKKSQGEGVAKSRSEDTEKTSELKSVLAGRISRSLDPIKLWLSATSEGNTKTEMESILNSTIEELKRNVSQIAIQTSYSEPPSDKSMIEALIDLREPLMRLRNAISVYHEPENLSTLEGLNRPMKHLLQTIMDVLRERAEEESLRSIIDIVEQIEDQISLSIKEALYRQEIKQFDKTSTLETEQEEAVTASRETIPGTLTEIASTPLETWTAPLHTEQAVTEDNSKKISDDVLTTIATDNASQIVRDEQQEREEKASKLIVSLSETLEKLQLEMTGILEDFEESATVSVTIPHSKLANSLEELRRTVCTIRVMTTVYGEEIGTFDEKVNQATLVLTNLLQPLTNIRKLLSREHEHDVSELMILNRLTPLLDMIESDVIQRSIGFVGKGGDTEKEFESLLCMLEEIKTEIPLVVQEVSSKRKTLECLRDISKPLESILERMSDLEKAAEETLETDVASILGKPTAVFLKDVKIAAQELQTLDKRGPVILELRNLLEPLLEFHSCLSMVQSSRRSLVPEDALLEERRNVILRAVDGLQQQVCHIVETIASMEEASLFNESLTQLNSAILQVQKQIGKTDYSRRSSGSNISLQHRLAGTLNRLAGTIVTVQVDADKDTYGIVSKSLEALQKQISLAQMQFIQTGGQLIDEEAIVEGFLYPANQLLSALNVLEENTRQTALSTISRDSMNQLRKLADSISELSFSLSAHRTELVRDGTSRTAPIVETFSAVIDVLDLVKDSIMTIEKTNQIEEEKGSVIITKVDSITDEIIEISQEHTIMTVTEIPPFKAVSEEVVQLQIEDTSTTTQTSDLENLKILSTEQMEDNLADVTKCEENQEVQKFEQHSGVANQISKLNMKMRNLQQPLRELIDFAISATQESLVSKSEEDKRKIRELTALTQILHDLQATNASIKTVLSSSSIVPLANQFSRMENILADLERATGTVISLTSEGVRPELKENIVASLQTLVEPLDALENVFASIYQTIEKDKYVEGESLIAIAKILMPCISDTVKCLNAIRVTECVGIADEKETSKAKEEAKDIEETTARPLEELIEAIMDSQEQVKCDKTPSFESKSPSTEPTVGSKAMEDVIVTETETKLNKSHEEADSSAMKIIKPIADADTKTSQLALTSSLIEELPVEEKTATPKSITESLDEIEVQSLSKIDQPKIETVELSENDAMQGEREKTETLQAIISPLQELCKSLVDVCEMKTVKLLDEKTVAVSSLTEPLLNLELMLNREIQQVVSLPSEEIEEMKHDEATPQTLSVTSVLEELQKSIAIVHEQVQLNTVADVDSSETSKMRLMQAVEKPLEELKMSIACIQTDPSICYQMEELSSTEQIAVLQTIAKSVEEFGERFTSIVDQLKIETEFTPQIVEQEEQKLDQDVLRKIVDPIHILRETLSQIKDLQNDKIEISKISEQEREIIQLSAVMHLLEKLEQSLNTGVQQVMVTQEAITKEFNENRVFLANADLKPVLEELKNSIVVVQQQAVRNEDIAVAKTLNEAFEGLKGPLTAIEEIVDRFDEISETEKVSTLLTFAKSVEETANRLVTVANQQMTQRDIEETSLLKMITIPIEGLQSAILKLEDRVSQMTETKETIKTVALECMLQPLQQLQQSLLTAPHQEAVLSLQQLPIRPILNDLNKFVATIQDQIMLAQDKLSFTEENADDLVALRDFARSLGDLRTSTVVLQQLNAIENASQQIVEIENASALQAFAKSIEEFRKCCSIVTERPKIVDVFTTNVQLERSTKLDTQLLENIIAPLRILQEQILTIDETKTQQSETLDVTEARKPVTVLSSLVEPLQQLEKSFVATVQKAHVIEHEECNLTPESLLMNLERFSLQPILEEVQQSIASVQEQVILEAGSHVISEMETSALLKSIAQPLVDLRASIASVQQATGLAPDPLNELAQQQNVSALETFAESLHSLAERIAMCNHQQIIMEPAADTISEDVSSLNTWADVIEEPLSKITYPMVIDQGTIESPAETAVSISEDEVSALRTLAKPLTELRECLALIIEDRKVITPSEVACSLSQSKDMSLLKTMIQPLLELKNAVTALIIQEQTAVERASEDSFAVEGNSESTLRVWIEPLEELRHSIAVIQDQMLVETPVDRPKDDFVLDTLAEPLFDLQRAISVLETRAISPDAESMLGDSSSNWITECLAVPLHEIEKSIADIRQCTVMEPKTVIVEEQVKALTPDWSIVEKLTKPMEDIQSIILHIEDDSTQTAALKAMVRPLANLQENLTLLKNKSLSVVDEEGNADAVVESLATLEKCISSVQGKINDKSLAERSITTKTDISVLDVLTSPLIELKRAIVTVEELPSVYFKNLERPLGLVQEALEIVLSTQQREKLSNLSTKLTSVILNINESIDSMEHRFNEQEAPDVLEIHIECEALRMLANPLQNIKKCIARIQEEPSSANSMTSALQSLEKSIAIIQEQSADKPLTESHHLDVITGFSKNLIPCLHELQESMEMSKTLWHKETVLEGLTILEKPLFKLQTVINIINDQCLKGKVMWTVEKDEVKSQKRIVETEMQKSENEAIVEEDDKSNKIIEKIEKIKVTKDKDSSVISDVKDKESKEKLEERKEEEEQKKQEDKELARKETKQYKTNKNEIEKEEGNKEEAVEKTQETKKEEVKNKVIENVTKETEQNEKSIQDEKKQKDKIEHKTTEDEEIKQFKKEKTDVIEEKKSKEFAEAEKIKKNEQKDIEDQRKLKIIEDEQKEKTLQEKKESNGMKELEVDLNVKTKETENEERKEIENTKKEEEQLKEKKEPDEIEKAKRNENDTKKDDRVKLAKQHENNEIEKIKTEKEIQKKEKETDRTKQKEQQETIKAKEAQILQKEEDNRNNEAKANEIKEEKDKIMRENEKLAMESEDLQNKGNNALRQNKDFYEKEKTTEDMKMEESEKAKDEKVAEPEKKENESSKQEKAAQMKIKKKEEKKKEEIEDEKQKRKDSIEKVKDKKNVKGEKSEEVTKSQEESRETKKTAQEKMKKDEEEENKSKEQKSEEVIEKTRRQKEENKKPEKLKEEKQNTNKKDEAAAEQVEIKEVEIKEEKQKEKEEDDRSKEKNEARKEQIQIEKMEITKDEQTKMKADVKEAKKKAIQKKNKKENEKIEAISKEREKKIEEDFRKKEEIPQTQDEYVNNIEKIDDKNRSERQYKETNENQEQDKRLSMKQKQEEELEKKIHEIQPIEDKDVHSKTVESHEMQRNDRMLGREEELKIPQYDKNWLRTEEEEQISRSDEYKVQKEIDDRQKRHNETSRKLQRIETECLERRKTAGRFERKEADHTLGSDEEMLQRRNDEKRIRRDETARLLREEEQRLRRRREDEITRNKQRREEQIREDEWSRRRENETDRFLKNMLDNRCRLEKSIAMSFDSDYSRDRREYTSRFDSSMPAMLVSTPKSYSWRDSLASLSRKIDDYWDYKLHDSSMDKYSLDAGSSYYRRRRKREDRMFHAKSIGWLKYEDYSSSENDARAWLSRRAKTETIPRISFDGSSSSNYIGLGQTEGPPMWDKPKKPSFCTRLTNRIVGAGMRMRLTCTVLGNPEPRVHWTKDGQKVDASNSRCRMRLENGMAYLELHDALPEDAGVYTCVAENAHGTSTSESTLKVYSDYKPTYSPPIFARPIKDTYRYSDRKLILECRVRAHPSPTVSWLKDGEILRGERYKPMYLDDDVYRLEITNPDVSDNGQYTCRAINDLRTEEISHMIHVDDREWQPASHTNRRRLGDKTASEVTRRPRFCNLLKDYSVPAGGTIAVQVEVKGVPAPEVKWLHGERNEPIAIPKAKTFVERGLHTLIVPEATESERGTYVCRAINAYGQVDTSVTVDVISTSAIDGGKPAEFVSRPVKKSIDVTVGEDVSVSFRVGGIPKPRVIWTKGLTDITDGPRSYKESIDDYVRLTLKRAMPIDEGTYCILVKNRYGCDRCFFSIKVKQRARSLTPSPDWNSLTDREAAEERDDDMSYVKTLRKTKSNLRDMKPHDHGIVADDENGEITISRLRRSWANKNCLIVDFLEYLYGHRDVPGPISSEPVVVDGGKNWLSLTWGKAERRGPAPVIAYKVEAWLLGGEGGARWMELGITPINAFDAFNLRPGGEYKFRVTPRNRYGWGEPLTMASSVVMSDSTDLPEFTKILPGQLKVLEGTPVKLECEIRGDPKMEVRWYRETTEIEPRSDSRFAIYHAGLKSTLTIADVKENDSGRYVCEASNRIGKVSSFARVLVVNDPRIIEADEKLKTSAETEDRPPQFTMRLRDRRVQTTYPVRLTCQIIGHPVPEITWYKNETEIIQDDRHVFWDDDSNFHTLEIIHSTLDDSGSYMVTARNINGSVSCRSTLVVDKGIRAYIAPEFLRDFDAAYTIRAGDELRMSAQLEAYPSVGLVWHRDGIRLRPSRRAAMTLSHDGTVQFSLANVTARDAGVYSCTATNAVGHTETSTRVAIIAAQDQDRPSVDELYSVTNASPDIPYSKEPLFVTKPLSTEAIEGDPVIILCEVVGDPKPEVMWLRDFLKPDYYRDAPHFRLVGAGPEYRLEIPYAKLDFTGTYSVIARNCHGEAKAVISLQIYAKGQGKKDQTQKSPHGKVLTLPIVKRELRDLRCCDGDAVSLECKFHATPEPPFVRWERGGKIIAMAGDFAAEFDGETARLSIQHVYPEDEGEYTCVAYNDLGKAYTSACLVVDVPEGKENILSQRLMRPTGLLSAGSTPRSTPRSTPIRSLSPAVSHGRELRSPQVLPRRTASSRRPRACPPKFYAVPHNRLVQEGETVRFQCAVVGHPAPWVRWDKNGSVVTPSARITIKERDDVKILEIVDVMREDAALYRVTAENDYGRIEASARLEVISRYESTGRTVRTRSASPRTAYPSFDRSLLSTTGRINDRLQLECRVRGTPNVTLTWYRNGRPLERSARIRRHYDGATAKIEITKVKASDAGEYTCVATNVLGSTRNNCQVTVLHPHDPSDADRRAPRFLRALPPESIVMENHRYELQTGVAGTLPLTIAWSKDGRELPDNDYYRHIVYGDGGIALRLPEVRPQDAGEYVCVVRNNFGVASCSCLLAVQDYKDVPELALQLTKTPLSVIAARGSTACFCARVQSRKSAEVIWTINGRDARQNAKCKVERDGDVSILRVRDVSSRDTGEIRCTATTNDRAPSVSCVAKLRLLPDATEDGESSSSVEPSQTKNVARTTSSSSKRRLGRSSSFPRRTIATCDKHVSPLPTKKRTSASDDFRKSRREGTSTGRLAENDLDKAANTNEPSLSSSSDTYANKDRQSRSLSLRKAEQSYHRHADVIEDRTNDRIYDSEPPCSSNERNGKSIIDSAPCGDGRETTSYKGDANGEKAEPRLEPTRATIVEGPNDVTVFRGGRAIVSVTYQGLPEPTVKWLRVNRALRPDERCIGIISGRGTSRLTLDDITYDHAGKYEVSVENPLGKERRFFSLAVEGPPEPPVHQPSVNVAEGRATIAWRSSPYDGGRTVLGYNVEARRAGENTWTVIAESCHSLSETVTSTTFVAPGETYCFRVRAGNIHGLGEPGIESDPIRIPRQGETMFQEEEEDEFEPSFEARTVEPEEGRLFGERYDVLEELGKGRYGVVKKVIERESGTCLAAKFVRTIKAKDREQVREEIRIMNALRHPKLLLLAAAYERPRETVMVMEYISGGELFERVVADDFTLTERDSILFMRQICEGVEYMHENKIVHLDLKPENIMCRTRTSHQIKLIDFGLAQTLNPDTPVRVLFGTPEFIPPEIISYEPIGTESDMWSVGVICYVLLTGLSPFMGDNDAETFANITRADYDLEDEAFDAISDDAKDFISGLLIKRKELRMSAVQCLKHPWMAQCTAVMRRIALPTDKLKKFIIRRKWQKTGNAIRALGRMAILSAYNKRSPTTTAKSPTSEQRFDAIDTRRLDSELKSVQEVRSDDYINGYTDDIRTNAEQSFVEAESQGGSYFRSHTTEENMEIQKHMLIDNVEQSVVLDADRTEEKVIEASKHKSDSEDELENIGTVVDEELSTIGESISSNCSERISVGRGTSETNVTLKTESVSQRVTTHLEIFISNEDRPSDLKPIERSNEAERQAIPLSQTRTMFRGDSRDSGIGDCSCQLTSALQVDELGIVSIIEEETDSEIFNREIRDAASENTVTLKNRQTASILTGPECKKEIALRATDSNQIDGKVATKSSVTKASCEINPERRVADENTDARILIGRNHGKFLPTGNVSRTARIFERETARSKDSQTFATQRAYPPTIVAEKPYAERIQKAFAFWNK